MKAIPWSRLAAVRWRKADSFEVILKVELIRLANEWDVGGEKKERMISIFSLNSVKGDLLRKTWVE